MRHFADPDGTPITEYLTRVRQRFSQWIDDTCHRDWDQAWLDYQHEIARRHTYDAKNRTDDVTSTPHIPLRLLVAFIVPITATVRPFLERADATTAEVDATHDAWFKAVTVQVTLWSLAYAGDGW